MNSRINTNSIAFIGLCNEFCVAVENTRESTREEFTDRMLRLLPRIYIAATDLTMTRPNIPSRTSTMCLKKTIMMPYAATWRPSSARTTCTWKCSRRT